MKKLQGKYITLLLIFALCISLLQPFTARANMIEGAKQLKKGQLIEGQFDEPGQVHWYKIIPSKDEINKDTHMRITMMSGFEGNVTVYPDMDRAQKDESFDTYRAYFIGEEPVQIDMPHAWSGPYYIKVDFFGGHVDEMGVDEEFEEPAEPIVSSYQIGYEGVTLPPSEIIGEACPVELSAAKKSSGAEILTQLRYLRNNLLSKTEKGEKLSSLYYKMAPYLVTKMVTDKNIRETVYKDLVQLKPLFKDVVENGENSKYLLTKKDQEIINELYEIVINHVPENIKEEIELIAKEIGLADLAGKKVSFVLKNNGMAISKSDTNRVIVKLKNGKTVSSFQQKTKALIKHSTISSLKSNDKVVGNTFVMEVKNDVKTMANQLMKLSEVEYAEPVYKYTKQSSDVQYPNQWSLKNTGLDFGKKNADIQYENLQPLLKQKLEQKKLEEIIIAVIDTGVDYTLADLKGKINKEIGYDFVNRDNDPYDDQGHGTHVAGIIAANSNNSYSMAGIHQKAKILPIKVLDGTGSGDTDKIALGIKYAVDKGAKVINLSLGGPKSRVIEDMLKYAVSKNVTVVAASGNDGKEMVNYPASSPYTIAVGATNRLDIVSDFSSYGPGLDLVAPGTEIPSLVPNGNITFLSGTSMATPHVAAIAGLLLSEQPTLKPDKVKQILSQTANDVAVEEVNNNDIYYDDDMDDIYIDEQEPGYDIASGWGRLNAWSAFSAVDLGITINELTDDDIKITGKAIKGTQVELKNGKKSLGKAVVKEGGTFSITIKPQKADQILQLIAKKGSAETSVKVIVLQNPIPSKPKVNAISDRDEVVSGKVNAGITVKVKTKTNVIGTAKVDSKGQFKVKIKKQKAGTTLNVTAISNSKKESQATKVVVKDKTPPARPKVKTVSDRNRLVTGTTEANATIIVKSKGKSIGSKKADAKGNFKVTIKKQKAGTVLYVTSKDGSKNISKATKVVVKDKTPPALPKVNAVTNKDKLVTGTAEARATIIVKHKGKTIGTKKADAKGKFKIKIKKQKAGTILYVTAKDAAGNISKAKKVTVKKSKK